MSDLIVMPVKLESQFQLSPSEKDSFILGPHGKTQCLHKHNPHLVPRVTCKGPLQLSFPMGKGDHGMLRPNLTCQKCGFDSQTWGYINLSADEVTSWELRLALWIYVSAVPNARQYANTPFVHDRTSSVYTCHNTLLSEQNKGQLHLALLPNNMLEKKALDASYLIISALANESRRHEQRVKKVLGHRH